MTKTEDLNLLDYVEDVTKANIGPMNVDHQETNKATCYHWETTWGGALAASQVKCDPVIPSHC